MDVVAALQEGDSGLHIGALLLGIVPAPRAGLQHEQALALRVSQFEPAIVPQEFVGIYIVRHSHHSEVGADGGLRGDVHLYGAGVIGKVIVAIHVDVLGVPAGQGQLSRLGPVFLQVGDAVKVRRLINFQCLTASYAICIVQQGMIVGASLPLAEPVFPQFVQVTGDQVVAPAVALAPHKDGHLAAAEVPGPDVVFIAVFRLSWIDDQADGGLLGADLFLCDAALHFGRSYQLVQGLSQQPLRPIGLGVGRPGALFGSLRTGPLPGHQCAQLHGPVVVLAVNGVEGHHQL